MQRHSSIAEKGIDRRESAREPLFHGRRRYPRLEAQVDVYLETQDRLASSGAVDLSMRGVFFRTRRPEPIGSQAVVRIALPGHAAMVRVVAEVVRVSADGVGLAFREMSEADRAILAAFLLRTLGFRALPQLDRRFGRLLRLPA